MLKLLFMVMAVCWFKDVLFSLKLGTIHGHGCLLVQGCSLQVKNTFHGHGCLLIQGCSLQVKTTFHGHGCLLIQGVLKFKTTNHCHGMAVGGRRWMCHAFMATGDSGDRLSHAVGCAFGICLGKTTFFLPNM